MSSLFLKVLSWNVHGLPWPASIDRRNRMQRIAGKILEHKPDVVLLQEVWFDSDARYFGSALSADYLPICAARSRGAPRGGLLAYLRTSDGASLAAQPEFHEFQASAPAWKVWEGDGLGRKGLLSAEIRRDGQRFIIVNTHLQSQYPCNDYLGVREAQITELGRFLERLDPEAPALVAGDFNTDSKESRLYNTIVAMGADLTEETRRRSGCGTILDGTGQWIDYVLLKSSGNRLLSSNFELISNEGPDRPYSDHQGLVGTVRLSRRA
jgi:endonuclease/exonuclease/phosphatase family metal-dependent hydrolase